MVGVDTTLTQHELLMEELAKKEVKRKLKLDKKKRAKLLGELPPTIEVNSDVDGLTSLGTIHEDFGLRNFDHRKLDQIQEEQEKIHTWNKNKIIYSIKVPPHFQQHKKEQLLEHFRDTKQQELQQILDRNPDKRTHEILNDQNKLADGSADVATIAGTQIRLHKEELDQQEPSTLERYVTEITRAQTQLHQQLKDQKKAYMDDSHMRKTKKRFKIHTYDHKYVKAM